MQGLSASCDTPLGVLARRDGDRLQLLDWKTGGGGIWQTGSYDPATKLLYVGYGDGAESAPRSNCSPNCSRMAPPKSI